MIATVLFLVVVLILAVVYGSSLRAEGFANANANTAHPWMEEGPLEQKDGIVPEAPGAHFPQHNEMLDFVPDGPSPTDLYNRKPYLLLEDVKAVKATAQTQAAVNAQTCFQNDITNDLSKVGSYRQMTNNYKWDLPDNCSALNKDVAFQPYGV